MKIIMDFEQWLFEAKKLQNSFIHRDTYRQPGSQKKFALFIPDIYSQKLAAF